MQIRFQGTKCLAGVLFALAAIAGTSARAVPVKPADGKFPARSESIPESPANAEFRKGVEAGLQGKNAIARAHFLAALKQNEKFAPALIGLADLAQKDGDRSQAEKYLKQAESVAPQAAEVYLGWGRFHLGSGQFTQAEKSFRQARDLNPKSIAPLLELGDLYLRDPSRHGDAAQSFAAAVELAPDNKFAVYSFGIASAQIGRREDALKAFERAAALAPKDPAPLRAAGRLHLEAGATDQALNAFDRGLKRQPIFVPLMLDRSDALARQGKWEQAISQLGAAARAAPDSAEVQVKLGDAYQGARRWDEARSAYGRAIKLDGKNPVPHNNLAWMLVQQGSSPQKAVEEARQAVSLAPNSAPFLDTLGWAQRAAGDLPGASESLRRATEIEPKSAEFQFHYGIVLMELQRTADARTALNRALDPQFPKADEARRLLRSLPAN